MLPGIVAAAAAAVLLALHAQQALFDRHEVYRTLRRVRTHGDPRAAALARTPLRRLGDAVLHLGANLARLTRLDPLARISRALAYAGSPDTWDAHRVLAAKLACAGAAIPLAALASSGTAPVRRAALVVFGSLVASQIPDQILRSRASRRQDAIRRALPDTLDLVAVTVQAGLGFEAALGRVARQASGPLAEELHRAIREMQLGKPRSQALRDLGERSSVPELKSFVLALVQADAFGVSIARVLQAQAGDMRVKRRQHAEERAQKLPVKIVFPLVFCIMPALFVVVLGPAAINIYRSLFGA